MNHAQDSRPLVSVVVPGYNEETLVQENLRTLCDYLDSLHNSYRWELIFINDGSTDATGQKAEEFAAERDNVTVLHHPRNFRLGQALRYAFKHCLGEYIITMDLDLSYSPDHIERLLDKITSTGAKIVVASPYCRGGTVGNVPWHRKQLSIWANRFLSFSARRRISTLTGMVRAYDSVFLSKLNLNSMDVDINPEIIFKAALLRAHIVEIPAHLCWSFRKQQKGAKRRRSSLRILRTVVSCLVAGFIYRPTVFFLLPGVVLLVLALYPLVWTIIHTANALRTLTDAGLPPLYRLSDAIAAAYLKAPHAFLVAGFAMIVGIQMIGLAIIALQNQRYFEELFFLGSSVYNQSKSRRNVLDG